MSGDNMAEKNKERVRVGDNKEEIRCNEREVLYVLQKRFKTMTMQNVM
jgi:hypothetical protein